MSDVIEEISQRSRAAILANLDKAYHIPDFTKTELPDPVCHIKMDADLVANFRENAVANMFTIRECEDSPEALRSTIASILQEENAQSLMYARGLPFDASSLEVAAKRCYDEPVENLRQTVFSADVSIVQAQCGVASHGNVMLCSGPNQPRLLSLAMPTCIMLLKKSQIVKSLGEALAPFERHANAADAAAASGTGTGTSTGAVAGAGNAVAVAGAGAGTLPANIFFVAGPSRTSDIELKIVLGVHGSRKVYLVLY